MTLPSTGSISFGQIKNEFGLPTNKNLGAYRINQSVGTLSNLPLDTGIPKSGSISFSDFRGKKLNVVVNYYSGSINNSHRSGNYKVEYNARARYNQRAVTVIGGFKGRPSNTSGTKVYVNVNVTMGSEKVNNSTRVALRTGSWENGTELIIVIGPNGRLLGSGGNGGDGEGTVSGFTIGKSGTSALGIEYNGTKIINGGIIRKGFGGGGASRGYAARSGTLEGGNFYGTTIGSAGCGGGGGSGYPAGNGGAGGQVVFSWGVPQRLKFTQPGNPGSNGDITNGGSGGAAIVSFSIYVGAGGGGAGNNRANAVDGGTTSGPYLGSTQSLSGSSAGPNGYAIVKSNGVSYTLEGNPLIGGVLTANPT